MVLRIAPQHQSPDRSANGQLRANRKFIYINCYIHCIKGYCPFVPKVTSLPDLNAAAIEARLIELKQEHRDLDLAIAALVGTPRHDELRLKRLKKRKLLLKDQIAFLESQLDPDISA